jgi:hypothetical protein
MIDIPLAITIIMAVAILWLVYFIGKFFFDVYRETSFPTNKHDQH